jgi:hypothetical protein
VPRVLYVAGNGFSGSTLLSFLLNAHPAIASVGEAVGPIPSEKSPREYVCSCGSALAACPFWERVGRSMAARGFVFDPEHWDLGFEVGKSRITRHLLVRSLRSRHVDELRDRLVLRLPRIGARMGELARRNVAFVESVLEATGKPVFADASKDPMRARYLTRLAGLDLRLVHLVRDAPGYVRSWIKNTGGTLDGGIRAWNRMASHVERLFPAGGIQRLVVRYEDVCRETAKEVSRIAEFAGLAPVEGPIRFRECEHHVLGNRMRLMSSAEIALDESWREALSRAEVEAIVRRTHVHRTRFGYA